MSIKTQTKAIRWREKACDGELKTLTKSYINPKQCYKKIR